MTRKPWYSWVADGLHRLLPPRREGRLVFSYRRFDDIMQNREDSVALIAFAVRQPHSQAREQHSDVLDDFLQVGAWPLCCSILDSHDYAPFTPPFLMAAARAHAVSTPQRTRTHSM